MVRASPSIGVAEGWKYGFLWWLYQPTDVHGFIWDGSGFGGQELMVFPKEELIVVFTGWRVLDDPVKTRDLVSRILPAVRSQSCNAPH